MPLPTWGCALMLAPAMVLLLTIIAIPFVTLQWKVRLPPHDMAPAALSPEL